MIFDPRTAARPLILATFVAASCASLSGCIGLAIGGAAAGTAVVLTDRRSSGVQVDDQSLEFKIEARMRNRLGDTSSVTASVYDNRVLLTGEVPTPADKDKANAVMREFPGVTSIYNQLNVGPLLSLSDRSQDTWLSSKVRSILLKTKYVPSGSISVTTDHGTVYLMGKVTSQEATYASNAVAGVGGVTRVVTLFEIITSQQATALSNGQSTSDSGKSVPTPEQSPAPIQSGSTNDMNGGSGAAVQAMPIK